MVRTRFAPSPTGYMHIGGIRTALYAYLFAKKNDGVFILRIEDTDQERFVPGATESIYECLRMAGLNWDEGPEAGGSYGPYIQSQRQAMYLPYAEQLINAGKAYYCFCTKDELDARRAEAEAKGENWKYDRHCADMPLEEAKRRVAAGESYVIRQRIPDTGEASFDDAVYGHISVDYSELDDMVLIKADGMPTYNFANVVDDHCMEVTHILRGNEFLASTPKYNMLYDAFGWQKPVYIHLTPVMKDSTRKLSKRHGDPSFGDLLDMGFLTEAVVNYIALVGWNPGDEREIFTLQGLIDAFSIEGLSKSPAIFDMTKLTWMNAEYIRKMTEAEFDSHAEKYYVQAGISGMDKALLRRILQQRLERMNDIPGMVDFLTALDDDYPIEHFINKKSKTDAEISKQVLDMAIPELEALQAWDEQSIHDALITLAEKNSLKNGTMLWPVRIAMAGKQVTPGGAIEIALLLGRDETLRRLKFGRAKLG